MSTKTKLSGAIAITVVGQQNASGSSSPYLNLSKGELPVVRFEEGDVSITLSLGVLHDETANYLNGTVAVSLKGATPASDVKPIRGGGGGLKWGAPNSTLVSQGSASGQLQVTGSRGEPLRTLAYSVKFSAPMNWGGATLTFSGTWEIEATLS